MKRCWCLCSTWRKPKGVVHQIAVAEALSDLTANDNPAVSLYQADFDVIARVTCRASTGQEAKSRSMSAVKAIVQRLGSSAYGMDIPGLPHAVVHKLNADGRKLAVAEAGTDGLIAQMLEEMPQAEAFLRYHLVADGNRIKIQTLKVSESLIQRYGVASEEVAAAMAAGAVEKSADVALAVTGSFNREDPLSLPGVFYIAVCDQSNRTVKKLDLTQERGDVETLKKLLAMTALNTLRLFLADFRPGAQRVDTASGTGRAVSQLAAAGTVGVAAGTVAAAAAHPPVVFRDPDEEMNAATKEIPLKDILSGTDVASSVKGSSTDMAASSADGKEAGKEGEKSGKKDEKKLPWYKRFVKNCIPMKGDPPKEVVRKLIFIFAVVICLGSSAYIINHFYSSYANKILSQEVQDIYKHGDQLPLPDDYPEGYLHKFAGLYEINPDIKGWLEIEGTDLSYPVLQAADNEVYHRADINKEYNFHGVPFLDYEASVADPVSTNLLIYGHNINDDGQMFSPLTSYQKLSFYQEHPVITFDSVYREGKYKIISVFIANTLSDDGPVFDYHTFINSTSEEATQSYLDEVLARSLINTTVDVNTSDELLTLSTCTYEFTGARFVVVARRVRDGESEEVDVNNAKNNPNPKMPDTWYKLYSKNFDSGTSVASPDSSSEESASVSSHSSASSSGTGSSSAATSSSASSSAGHSGTSSGTASSSSSSSSSSRPSSSSSSSPSSSSSSSRPNSSSSSSSSRPSSSSSSSSSLPPSSSSSTESIPDSSSDPTPPDSSSEETGGSESNGANNASPMAETFVVNGTRMAAEDAVAQIVQNEMGNTFQVEALKAQAVATYTYIQYNGGVVSGVGLKSNVSNVVSNAVRSVLGEMVVDAASGRPILAVYHSSSAGVTNPAQAVWGRNVSNLVSVESPYDNDTATLTLSREKVESYVTKNLNVNLQDDPAEWFRILDYTTSDNLYVNNMMVGDVKTTGRKFRENILRDSSILLRSAAFTVRYDSSSDQFIFQTKGYGHGAGMSQKGANAYASRGYSYKQILTHYYSSARVVG